LANAVGERSPPKKRNNNLNSPSFPEMQNADGRNPGSKMSFKQNKERGGGGEAMRSKAKSGTLLATIESGDNGTRI